MYPTFADYSGLTSPTVAELVDRRLHDQATCSAGRRAAYDAHDPPALLTTNPTRTSGGWFEVGTADLGPLAAQRELAPLAVGARIETCAVEIPGGLHDFDVWARSFRQSLPWMSYRLGLTPKPADEPASCGLG